MSIFRIPRINPATLAAAALLASSAPALAELAALNRHCGLDCRLVDLDSGLTWSRERPAASWEEAQQRCADEGLRLPTLSDLVQIGHEELVRGGERYPAFRASGAGLWTAGRDECSARYPGGSLLLDCTRRASAFRCVGQEERVPAALTCAERVRYQVAVTLSNGAVAYEVVMIEAPDLTALVGQIESLANGGQESDADAAQLALALTPALRRYGARAEASLGLAVSERFHEIRRALRYERIGLASRVQRILDEIDAIGPASRLKPELFDQILCRLAELETRVVDRERLQAPLTTCSADAYGSVSGLLCAHPGRHEAVYTADFRGQDWELVGRTEDDLVFTHLLRDPASGSVFAFAPDELRVLTRDAPAP